MFSENHPKIVIAIISLALAIGAIGIVQASLGAL